jgi:hypothetical protein
VRATLAQQAHTQQRLGQCAVTVLLEPFRLTVQHHAYLALQVDMEQEQALLTSAQDNVLQVDMELDQLINAQAFVQLALTQPLDLQRALLAQLEHMAQQPGLLLTLVPVPSLLAL